MTLSVYSNLRFDNDRIFEFKVFFKNLIFEFTVIFGHFIEIFCVAFFFRESVNTPPAPLFLFGVLGLFCTNNKDSIVC